MRVGGWVVGAVLFAGAPAWAQFATPTPDPGGMPDSAWTPSKQGKGMAVFDPAGVGVEPAQCAAIGDLLRAELKKLGVAVTPRSQMPAGECADEECAAAKAAPLLVNEAVVSRISRLDKKVLVIVTLVEVPSGKALFTDRMTAASLDDFDVLMVRVARGVQGRVPFSTTVDVDTVTANDARDPSRQKSFLTTGLRLGAVIPMAGAYGGATSLYAGDLVSLYEVRAFTIEAAAGFRANSEYSSREDTNFVETGVDLGGYYHINQEDISAFVGGGLGLHNISGRYIDPHTKDPADDEEVRVSSGGPAF
jgi:hypothetical protein